MRPFKSARPLLAAALAALLLAGCGAQGLSPVAPFEQGFSAQGKKAKRYGLGANLKGRPKVKYDIASASESMDAFAKRAAKVDLRRQCPPVYNQGTMGSCTGFAIAKGLGEFVLKKQNRHTELSALALYYMERKAMKTLNEDSGAYISTGMKILDNYGAPAEKAHPYPAPSIWNNKKLMHQALTLKPDNSVINDGKAFRVKGIKSVTSLSGIRTELAKGLPVVFGIMIYDSFYEAKKGQIPVPDLAKEKVQGGHAVAAVGYDNAKQVLIVRNSWGADWGDKGYFYLPYEFVRKGLVMDAWAAKI